MIPACRWQMNLFATSQVGLTEGLQSRSRGLTTEFYAELDPHIPCGPGNRNRRRARDWYWHSKYFASKLYRVHLRKLTHPNRPLLLVLTPLPHTDGCYAAQQHKPWGEYQSKKKTIWKGTKRHRRIKTGIQRKN